MNVVLVLVDTLRKDHVGAYGNRWIQTPNMDALARESLLFTNAYPESLPSIPARRGMHTGLRAFPFADWERTHEDDVGLRGWQPIPEGQVTLAEILRSQGFRTMFVTDTLHQFRAKYNFQLGFDVFDFIRGQERDQYRPLWMCPEEKMENTLLTGDPVGLERKMRQYFANTTWRQAEEDWFAPQVFTRSAQFLEGIRGGDPFFLFIDAYDPHEPWDPPEKYVKLYSDGYDGPEPYASAYGDAGYLTEQQLERMKALYAAEVTMVDHWLGEFLNKMDDLRLLDSTLLLFLSDHGYLFGEHGLVGKLAEATYPELIDIPMMIRHPEGRGAGQTSDYLASTHDVAPTVLGMLGIEPPASMEGQNLGVLFEGRDPQQERSYFTAGYHEHVWARDERYVMISRHDGSDAKLYDLERDPQQENDVSAGNPDAVKQMYEEYVLGDAGGALPYGSA